jgi:hypothetical protein
MSDQLTSILNELTQINNRLDVLDSHISAARGEIVSAVSQLEYDQLAGEAVPLITMNDTLRRHFEELCNPLIHNKNAAVNIIQTALLVWAFWSSGALG